MRKIGPTILAMASFAALAAGLHEFLPPPGVASVTPKIRFFAEHGDEYDTLFLGSSRVYHGVNPFVFDAAMAAGGRPSHSYNFGIDGMLPPETFYVINRLLAARPQRLRRIFIELEDVQVSVSQDHVKTRRALYWHDWERSAMIVRKVLELDVPEKWKQKRKRMLQNRGDLFTDLFLFAENLANIGRAFDLLGFAPVEDDLSTADYEPRGDGYAATGAHMSPEQAARYDVWLNREVADIQPRGVDTYAEADFRRYACAFRSIGATPIFLVTPSSGTFLPSRFQGAASETVMAFNDARRYPSLYRSEARLDEGHLNATGADELSRLLAERVLKLESGPRK